MVQRLSGKTALITGAAQGIGLAITEAFVREGARVTMTDLNADSLAAAAKHLDAEASPLDVADDGAIQSCAAKFGKLDVLVNCAGIVRSGPILECSHDDWDLSLLVNVTSMYRTIRAFLPAMLKLGRGSIINIASVVSSEKGAPDRFAYGTSKAAVIGLTKSVAVDYLGQGIRCNCISPGTVDSPSLHERLRKSGDYEGALAAFKARQPVGRLGQPGEIASVAVLLASDEAQYMTGSNIVIDGGWSI